MALLTRFLWGCQPFGAHFAQVLSYRDVGRALDFFAGPLDTRAT